MITNNQMLFWLSIYCGSEKMNNSNENKKIYEIKVKDYEKKVYDLDAPRIKKILKILSVLQKKSKGNILDIGCLSGVLLSKTRKSWNKYGTDIINKPMNFSKDYFYKRGNVEQKIPFEDNFFDIVIAGEVIEHLYDTDNFLKEITRILKSGGHLIITTPNLASLLNRMFLLFGKSPRYLEYRAGGSGHIHLYTLKNLKTQLVNIGFRIIKISGNFLSFPDPTPKKIIRNSILTTLGGVFPNLAENIIIVCVKK